MSLTDTPETDENPDVAHLGATSVDLVPDTAIAVDPLQALLDVGSKVEDITEDVLVKIIAPAGSETATVTTTFKLRVLSPDEIEEITDRATHFVKRGRGQSVKEVDQPKLQRLLVAKATIAPDLKHPQLLSKFGASEASQVVARVMLPGQVAALADKVLEVAGYDDEAIVSAAKS